MGEKWPPILPKMPLKFTLRVILHPKNLFNHIHCDIPKCSYDQSRGLATSLHSIWPAVKPPEFFHIVAPDIEPWSWTVSYTIKAVFVLLLFKIAISASCLLRRLYKIYMVWPSLLFKIYVPRHINFINGYIHFILFSYYSHLIYAISHIHFTRPTERTVVKNFLKMFVLCTINDDEIVGWVQNI